VAPGCTQAIVPGARGEGEAEGVKDGVGVKEGVGEEEGPGAGTVGRTEDVFLAEEAL